jgi:hypothetical protein
MSKVCSFDEYEDEYDDSFDAIGAYGVNDNNLGECEFTLLSPCSLVVHCGVFVAQRTKN